MTFAALLDTNILSDLIRRPRGRAAERLAPRRSERFCTSIVCTAELYFWVAKSGVRSLAEQVETVLANLTILPLDAPVDRRYGELRAMLDGGRQTLAPNDLLIAAHALTLGLTLVTHDAAFTRVPGLVVEDWLA